MSFDREPPPQRPGDGPRAGLDEPTRWSDYPEAGRPAPPPQTEAGKLALLVDETGRAVEYLWGQIDPRSDAPDRLRLCVGPATDVLETFFASATRFLGALDLIMSMLDEAEANDTYGATVVTSSSGGTPEKSGTVRPVEDKIVATVIDSLAAAGVEVDEADVESWTEEQRTVAVMWARSEHHILDGQPANPLRRPSFLPEV